MKCADTKKNSPNACCMVCGCCSFSTKKGRLVLAVNTWFSMLLVNFAACLYGPLIPVTASELGVSDFVLGSMLISGPLLVAILSPVFSILLPVMGVKYTMLSGITLIGGCELIMGFMGDIPTRREFVALTAVIFAVWGLGNIANYVPTLTLASTLYSQNTGIIMGLAEFAVGFGSVAAPLLGGLLFSIGGYKLPFIVGGSCILLSVPYLMAVIPNIETNRTLLPRKTLAALFTQLPFILLLISCILYQMSITFFLPTLSPFLLRKFHLTEMQITAVSVANYATFLPMTILFGQLTDRLGPQWFICSGPFITALGFFFIGPAPFISHSCSLWLTITSYAVIGVGTAASIAPEFASLLKIAKACDSTTPTATLNAFISGLIHALMAIGGVIGPLLGGTLTDTMGFQMSTAVFGELLIGEGLMLAGVALVDWGMTTSLGQRQQSDKNSCANSDIEMTQLKSS